MRTTPTALGSLNIEAVAPDVVTLMSCAARCVSSRHCHMFSFATDRHTNCEFSPPVLLPNDTAFYDVGSAVYARLISGGLLSANFSELLARGE